MQKEKILHTADTFKLLSDPTRLSIIHLLANTKEELCVGDIAEKVGISQSATSHQLAKLESKGVVFCTRKGQIACYAIASNELTENLKKVIEVFDNTSYARKAFEYIKK